MDKDSEFIANLRLKLSQYTGKKSKGGHILWLGPTTSLGYPQIGGHSSNETTTATRAAWMCHTNQLLSKGVDRITHICSEILCVNPKHLKLNGGGIPMNIGNARFHKLTSDQIKELKANKNGLSIAELAELYDLHPITVRYHTPKNLPKFKSTCSIRSEADIKNIRSDIRSTTEIAKEYKVSSHVILNIKLGKTYKWVQE